MKNTILIGIALMLLVSPCYGDEGESRSVVKDVTLREPSGPLVFVGKAESIIPAGPITANRSSIIVLDENGNEASFEVKTLAVIYDFTGRMISLDQIRKDSKVQINYRVLAGGTKEAASIKVLK